MAPVASASLGAWDNGVNNTMKKKHTHTSCRDIRLRTWLYRGSLSAVMAQVFLILASWLITAASPDVAMKSLLSAKGVRWFVGSFATNLASPLLVYIIVAVIAGGSLIAGGLWGALSKVMSGRRNQLSFREIFALRGALLIFVVENVVVLLLTFLPHAILLSITGALFPSSFSDGIVPILAFMVVSVSLFYGLAARTLSGVYEVGQAMTSLGHWVMPLLLFYVFASVFYHSFVYVFAI